MHDALVLAGAALSPLLGLTLLLWLAHLEDTLPRDVRAAQRQPPPPPILAIPVRSAPAPVPPARAEAAAAVPAAPPAQRPAPATQDALAS